MRRRYPFFMLRPPCKALLYAPEGMRYLAALEAAGCLVALAKDEATAATIKAEARPEAIFGAGLPPGAMGWLRRLPPPVEALYCLLVEHGQLEQIEIAPEYDEFLLLPLQPEEIAARIRLWRWRRQATAAAGQLRAGPLVVDTANYHVTISGAPVALTLKEYELLCLFLRRRGQLLTRAFLLDAIWGPDYYGGSRTVDVHVRRLRMKLPEIADQIRTVRGLGYRFEG